jgi:lipopolysaccharide export LptBFGC system permease protein LptF
MYYWNMLGLLAMGLALRAERPNQRPALGMLIGLHVIFMVFYLYQHLNRGLTEGYAVAWLITVLTIATAAWELRVTRRSEMVDSTT